MTNIFSLMFMFLEENVPSLIIPLIKKRGDRGTCYCHVTGVDNFEKKIFFVLYYTTNVFLIKIAVIRV